jgi:AraC-like DNA-binding protein
VDTLFSTVAVHPRERFDYWLDVACKTIVDHDSNPVCRRTFRAELQSGDLADIGVGLFENSPITVEHTLRHIAQAKRDEIFICRQMAGRLMLEQDGREVILASGDFMLLDPRLPYTAEFTEDSQMLVLKIPRSLLEARVGKTRALSALTTRPATAETALTSAFLGMLPTHICKLGIAAKGVVQEQVLDLIAVSLATAMEGRTPRLSSARSLVRMKVRAAIEAGLTDPALDAKYVAAAAGVSVRYANAVLAKESMSIMRLIQTRRLARCRRMLEDPSQAHRTVSEIAYGWGFSDMTHFGRKFREAYGMLPSEWRRCARSA